MRERRRAWRPGGWPSRSLPISQKRCLPYSSSRPSTTPFLLHFDYRISHHSQRPYDHQYNINSLPKEFEQQMLGGYVRTPQSSGGHGRVLTYLITGVWTKCQPDKMPTGQNANLGWHFVRDFFLWLAFCPDQLFGWHFVRTISRCLGIPPQRQRVGVL